MYVHTSTRSHRPHTLDSPTHIYIYIHRHYSHNQGMPRTFNYASVVRYDNLFQVLAGQSLVARNDFSVAVESPSSLFYPLLSSGFLIRWIVSCSPPRSSPSAPSSMSVPRCISQATKPNGSQTVSGIMSVERLSAQDMISSLHQNTSSSALHLFSLALLPRRKTQPV